MIYYFDFSNLIFNNNRNFFESEYLYLLMLFKFVKRVCEKKLFLNNVYFSKILIIMLFDFASLKINNNDLI